MRRLHSSQSICHIVLVIVQMTFVSVQMFLLLRHPATILRV